MAVSNVVTVQFPVNARVESMVEHAIICVRDLFWSYKDYDMFIGYLGQFIDNAESFKYEQWVDVISNYNVRGIK
tara:strand:- start:305 stop:526 length:222 start_codon:yes stop_codon:yes gene_type:complete